MRNNLTQKIRFQGFDYLKLNNCRTKILKKYQLKELNSMFKTRSISPSDKLLSKLIRKQEIILSLCRATKCPTEAEKIDYAKMSYYRPWKTN